MRFAILGALLTAAPLFSQVQPSAEPQLQDGAFHWFRMTESREQVMEALGKPRMVAPFGEDFVSWQFQIGNVDLHDFSHQVVFRKSTSKLVSITRNFEPEADVDRLFPPSESRVYRFNSFPIRVRKLAGGAVLMAIGVSKPGDKTGQLVLMLENEVRFFYAWLAEQLAQGK